MRLIRWWMLFLAIGGGGVTGCDAGPAAQTSAAAKREKIQVLATVYPLAEMAQRVGGERVEVQWLAEGGQRPEDLDPTPALRQTSNKAAVVVTSGPWDAWA